MKPVPEYLRRRTTTVAIDARLSNERFWAHIRTVSEELGYTDPQTGQISSPNTVHEIAAAMKSLRLKTTHLLLPSGDATAFGRELLQYLQFRARLLNDGVRPLLMNAAEAMREFIRCFKKYQPHPLSIPWNKQKNEKRAPAYLTGMVNMILGAALGESSCDFDPLSLTTVTIEGEPFRTLARRVDGAYPSVVNPTAVWEIKEYYYTTTFGSRVADGIYETLLDGLEIEYLEDSPHGKIFHYLIVDARDTWWGQGNPYLCRIVDMLHMGYIDEAVFGREVEPAMLRAAGEWKEWRIRQSASREAAREEQAAGMTPPPKHRRLSPSERRKRAGKWNAWAVANGLENSLVSGVESEVDRAIRVEWNRRRKGLSSATGESDQ